MPDICYFSLVLDEQTGEPFDSPAGMFGCHECKQQINADEMREHARKHRNAKARLLMTDWTPRKE